MSCYLLAYGGVGVLCPVDADADTQSRAEQRGDGDGDYLFIYLLGVGVLESCYDMVIWVCYGCML